MPDNCDCDVSKWRRTGYMKISIRHVTSCLAKLRQVIKMVPIHVLFVIYLVEIVVSEGCLYDESFKMYKFPIIYSLLSSQLSCYLRLIRV